MAAADRPQLVLRLGRARPWYAERMGSLASPAQLWSRARPADAERARSPRRAFAHQAGGGAGRARSHGTLVQRHGLFVRRGSRLRRAQTSRARGTCGMCQPLPSARHSAPAPAAHSPLPNVRFAAARHRQPGRHRHHHRRRGHRRLCRITSTFDDSNSLCPCSIGALRLQPRVAARRPGVSGRRSKWPRPRCRASAIIGRLGRPARARPAAQATLCGLPTTRALHSLAAEKKCAWERSFLAIPACLSARKHASRTPEARATHRYAAHALGSRTQNTMIRPS